MAAHLCEYIKNHLVVHIKWVTCVHFKWVTCMVYELHLNKAVCDNKNSPGNLYDKVIYREKNQLGYRGLNNILTNLT